MSDKLLTVEEVSERLQISRYTLYKLIESEDIVAIKLGRRTLRFEESEVNKFIERSKTKPEEINENK